MFSCLCWFAGTAIQTGVTGFGTLVAGRLLNGVTVGITSSQVPVYLAEIARKEKRGSLIIIQKLAIEWGILIMVRSSYLLLEVANRSVLPRICLHQDSWDSIFPDCLGNATHSMHLLCDWTTILA